YGGVAPNSSRHRRTLRPLRNSLATRHTGSGFSPGLALNSKSTSQISRKGRRNPFALGRSTSAGGEVSPASAGPSALPPSSNKLSCCRKRSLWVQQTDTSVTARRARAVAAVSGGRSDQQSDPETQP